MRSRFIVGAICACLLQASQLSFAQAVRGGEPIEGSYIVRFRASTASRASPIHPPLKEKSTSPPAFAEHGTGQSKETLAADLNIRGRVIRIFETINAAHLNIDEAEAARLREDPRVLTVTQDVRGNFAHDTQTNPGWALDRIDQALPLPQDSKYIYPANATGAGQTIYILDSGLTIPDSKIVAEFGSRATLVWDENNGYGFDCFGHGTRVASAAASKTYGTAKGATLKIAKITVACTGSTDPSTWIAAFNWLAANAPKGTIVNFSYGYQEASPGLCNLPPLIDTDVEAAIRAAHNAGIIIVVSAGNDGCNTANYTPQRMPEVFAVGGTSSVRFSTQQDGRYYEISGLPSGPWQSRYGTNISGFAPAQAVQLLNWNGNPITGSGTSFAAPYISGLFAVGCQVLGTFCSSIQTGTDAYNGMRAQGSLNTVVNFDGSPLPSGTTTRFFNRFGW